MSSAFFLEVDGGEKRVFQDYEWWDALAAFCLAVRDNETATLHWSS